MSHSTPWSSISLPKELLSIPGMLTIDEKRYLTWLTSEKYEGWGAIVDLGCWLGCSSSALAEGLKRAKRTDRVECRDLFNWEPCYMEEVYAANLPQDTDFQYLFEQFTAPYRQWISVKKSDLRTDAWTDGAIEILFVDAAKNWELTNQILESFGSQIVPGRTRVVLQDFRFSFAYWLPLVFDGRPDLWQEIEAVEEGWTVTFFASKPVLGTEGVTLPYAAADFSITNAEEIFRRRIDASKGEIRGYYQQGLVEFAKSVNRPSEAAALGREFAAHRSH